MSQMQGPLFEFPWELWLFSASLEEIWVEVVRHQQLRAASRTGRPSIAEQGAWAKTEILQIFADQVQKSSMISWEDTPFDSLIWLHCDKRGCVLYWLREHKAHRACKLLPSDQDSARKIGSLQTCTASQRHAKTGENRSCFTKVLQQIVDIWWYL